MVPAELSLEIPELLEELWFWFLELNSARSSNGFGPNAISYTEIKAWAELTNRDIKPSEVALIKHLDRIVLNGK